MFVIGCGVSPKEAKEYKEHLRLIHLPVVRMSDSLEMAFEAYDTVRIKKLIRRANLVNDNAIARLKKVEPITSDSNLYKNTMKFLRVFRSVLRNEYSEKLYLYCIPNENFTLQNQQEVVRLDASKREKLILASRKLEDAELEFAERYNLEIVD